MNPPPKRHPYDQWSPDARALDLVGDKWTLLIVRDLAPGPRRFVELQRVLPGISIEQLSSRLGRMVAAGLVTRHRYNEVPPRVEYELTARGERLLPVLGALARWGYRWAWTAPRDLEAIDIGAILRIAPGLGPLPAEISAEVELAVRVETETRHYALTIDAGAVAVAERPATDPDTQVSGSLEDWIAAFGPGRDRSGLCIAGDERPALLLLDLLRPPEPGERSG